jgi:type I restriction enzyme S subunit
MKTLGSGVRQTLSFTHIANSELVFPPLSEQTEIAQFLDDKTTKIDEAITIKQQQISLLKERKQILIHKAVTQGLNPNVKLKYSGVEWIGEIPEHWRVIRLKQGCLKVTDGAHISPEIGEEIKPFVSTVNIDNNGNIDLENCIYTTMKCYNYLVKTGCKPNLNDVLFSKDGTVGRTAIIDRELDFVVASSLIIIRPNLNIFSPYFLDLLLSSNHIKMQTDGILSGSALKRISIVKVSNLLLFKIPLSEQKEISVYIESASQKIETTISLKQQEIAKLKEYKSSLINSVVTGKVKVC